jgi:hypothetical protein
MAGNAIERKFTARMKCRAYKNKLEPDNRVSLAGEHVQTDKDGRQFFVVPSFLREDLMAKLPSYEFSAIYDVEDPPAEFKLETPVKVRPGKAGRTEGIDVT